MPRETAGLSPFGKMINKVGGKQDGQGQRQSNEMKGRIIAFRPADTVEKDGKSLVGEGTVDPSQAGLYEFKVRLSNGDITGFLELSGTMTEHAASIGLPADYINKWCTVNFKGPSSNTGKIISISDDYTSTDLVTRFNQVDIKGTAFAPPGGSNLV